MRANIVLMVLGIGGFVPGLVGSTASGTRHPASPLYRAAQGAAQSPAAAFVSARRLSGSLPSIPAPNVTGWIDERLEVAVDATGVVSWVKPFRITRMTPDPIVPALADWRFQPAAEQNKAVQSRVLVAAMIRPPQLFDAPVLGTAPTDLVPPSDEIPFPVSTAQPRYPPQAVSDAVVLVEVLVGLDGRVRETRIVSGDRGFHQTSLDAAKGWVFRPARRGGRPVDTLAYLIFGFRRPLVSG